MDILKDASTAAIYGSRAANGVIIIKTKRGAPDNEVKINYSSYFGNQSLDKTFPFITNSSDYVKVAKQALVNAGIDYTTEYGADHFLNRWDTDPNQFANSNWEDAYYKISFKEY